MCRFRLIGAGPTFCSTVPSAFSMLSPMCGVTTLPPFAIAE